MRRRLLIAIKLLLKENPVLPQHGFRFVGEELVQKYKQEEKEYLNL